MTTQERLWVAYHAATTDATRACLVDLLEYQHPARWLPGPQGGVRER